MGAGRWHGVLVFYEYLGAEPERRSHDGTEIRVLERLTLLLCRLRLDSVVSECPMYSYIQVRFLSDGPKRWSKLKHFAAWQKISFRD